MDGQGGNGLQLENVWQTFSSSVLVSTKKMFQEHFVCERRHLIKILAKF